MTTSGGDDPTPPRIPDHQVFRCIGEGSYGRVWLARTVLGTWRAVKVVHRQHFGSTTASDREFAGLRRFEPLSRSHPGFVDILQSGEDPVSGTFHYVMELADDASPSTGAPADAVADPANYRPRTLSEDLRIHGRLPPGECIRIGLILAGALSQLHREHLIHRDIKPANIVFVGGEPKLADIGLVVDVADARTFVGTEGYVAPEGPNSPQADLFSLGMVLYEAAMGMERRCYPSPGPAMRGGPDVVSLRELNAIVLKACATRCEDRYESAEAMAADLQLLRAGGSVQMRRRRERMMQGLTRITLISLALAAASWLSMALARRWSAHDGNSRFTQAHEHAAAGVRSMLAEDSGAAAVHLAESLTESGGASSNASIQAIRLRGILRHSPRPLVTMATESAVSSVAFSPDGRRLITGDANGNVQLWDADSGAILGRFSGMGGSVEVRFSQDGHRIWAMPCANDLRFNQAPARRVVLLDAFSLRSVGTDIRDVDIAAISPEGGHLALVQEGSLQIRLLDAATGSLRHVLTGHQSRISSIVFSRDGARLATGGVGTDRSVRLWNTADGRPIGRSLAGVEDIHRLGFHPRNGRILVATGSGLLNSTVSILDPSGKGSDIEVTRGTEFFSVTDAIAMGGRFFLLSDEPSGLSIRSFDDGKKILPSLALPSGQCISACIGPDETLVAASSDDGWVRVWNLLSGVPVTPPMQLGARVRALAFSPDTARLVTGTHQGVVRIWDLTTTRDDGEPRSVKGLMRPSPHPRFAYPATWLADDRLATITDVDGVATAQVIDPVSGSVVLVDRVPGPLPAGSLIAGHRGPVWASFNQLMGDQPGWHDVVLTQPGSKGWQSHRLPHVTPPGSVRFTPDDSRLLTIDREVRIRSWHTQDGSLEREVALFQSNPGEIALIPGFSPDTRWALWTDRPSRAHLYFSSWDTARPVVRKHAFKPGINSYAVHATMPLAAVATTDHRIHVLDLEQATEIPLPEIHGAPILTASFRWHPASRRLLIETDHGRFLLIDLERSVVLPVPGPLNGTSSPYCEFSPDGRWLVAALNDGRVWVADAVSGEPVTPWIPHAESVRFVAVTARDRLVTLDGQGVVRTWELKAAESPAAALQAQARLLSGRRIMGNDLEWMPPEALVKEAVSVASHPALTEIPTPNISAWHRIWARPADSIPHWESARFHARQLMSDPSNPASAAVRTRLERLAIPSRDPGSPVSALDLGSFYTHSLEMLSRDEFSRLPRGLVPLQGIPFDIRGMVRLEAPEFRTLLRATAEVPLDSFPVRTVSGIPVGRRCSRIHFLHGIEIRFRSPGEECARWRIRYADGGQQEFPLVLGRHLSDTTEPFRTPDSSTAPVVAWPPEDRTHTQKGAPNLNRVTWENPDPSNPVQSLDFVVGSGRSRPFVLAITLE